MIQKFQNFVFLEMLKALSFSGCGFNGAYHIGASKALTSKVDFKNLKFTGASAGLIGTELSVFDF